MTKAGRLAACAIAPVAPGVALKVAANRNDMLARSRSIRVHIVSASMEEGLSRPPRRRADARTEAGRYDRCHRRFRWNGGVAIRPAFGCGQSGLRASAPR